MSKQMVCDWIEQEFDLWVKNKICDPCGKAESCRYVAQLFAEHIMMRSSEFTGDKNNG